jgi:hypothetical protein
VLVGHPLLRDFGHLFIIFIHACVMTVPVVW